MLCTKGPPSNLSITNTSGKWVSTVSSAFHLWCCSFTLDLASLLILTLSLVVRPFGQLSFERNSVTFQEIKQKMRSFSNDATLRNAQCLILFILSHGQAIETPAGMVDCVYGCDGQPVTVNEILEPLTDVNCPHLRNKPKLVFFQACRGGKWQHKNWNIRVGNYFPDSMTQPDKTR